MKHRIGIQYEHELVALEFMKFSTGSINESVPHKNQMERTVVLLVLDDSAATWTELIYWKVVARLGSMATSCSGG